MRLWVLAALTGVAIYMATANVARGAPLLVPTNQTRTLDVSARVFDKTRADSASAGGFGDFNETLQVHPFVDVDGERHASQGNAAQRSSLGENRFAFAGSLYAQSIHPATSSASARNVFDVTFSVSEAASYTLAGFLRNPQDSPAGGTLSFTMLAGNEVLFAATAEDDAINSAGRLNAGAYRLVLDASGRGDSSEAGGGIEYDVTFAAAAEVGQAPAVPVPLPAGVWSGMALLILAAGLMHARRWKRRLVT